MQVRFGNHLHQRHSRAVEIDQTDTFPVPCLSRIFFHVQVVNTHPDRPSVIHVHIQPSARTDGLIVLGHLITAGHIRIKIIFPVKVRHPADLRMDGQAEPESLPHHLRIGRGQRPGLTGTDRADIGVRGIIL